MRRCRIPGDNIVSLLHGIAFVLLQISRVQSKNLIKLHVTLAPFCSVKC